MITITDKHRCCGCEACVQRCPKQCILFVEDNEGFLYPKPDVSVCIECGLCEKVCPVLNQGEPKHPLNAYAAINQDDDIHRPVTMEDWISNIVGSDVLVTNSFHGMVVALLNHIPFVVDIVGGREKGMNDRFYTLLERVNLTSRISGEKYSLMELLNNRSIDWEIVDKVIRQIQTEGMDYLKKALGEATK